MTQINQLTQTKPRGDKSCYLLYRSDIHFKGVIFILTVKDVSERLKVSEGTVRGWIKLGFLKAKKYGKQFRISEEDFRKLLDSGLRIFPREGTQNTQEVQ